MLPTVTLEHRDDGLTIAWLDTPDSAVNIFDETFPDEIDEVLDAVEADDDIRALVFASRKPHGFSAGADLRALDECTFIGEAEELSQRAQLAMQRLGAYRKPTGAAIHGACLGAGLELALACDVRVASSDRSTRLGLPEVKLGLVPGSGGTQRLPRLIGLTAAVDLLVSGREVDAADALDLTLVDEVCPAPILLQITCERTLESRAIRNRRATGLGQRLVRMLSERSNLARTLVIERARNEVRARTRGNYPAPERILDVVSAGLEDGLEAGLRAEHVAFAELAASDQSTELRRLFFLRRELAREPWVAPGTNARPIARVGVVGAGLMGSGIAALTVDRTGLPVCLADLTDDAIRRGLRSIRRAFDKRVARGRLTPLQRDRRMNRIGGTAGYRGFHACDLIIEAVVEDLATKRAVVRVVQACNERAIVASNTSALPIAQLAEASDHPEQVIGMHYFSPVATMPLLEIAVTDYTSPEVIATCVELGRRQGKQVIVVRDGVGFFTTRVLGAYLHEAVTLLQRGAPVDAIDEALVDFGFPIGPLALIDDVGIDIAQDIAQTLEAAFGQRLHSSDVSAQLLAFDRRGRKSARGFYQYTDGHRGAADDEIYHLLQLDPDPQAFAAETIAWRCVLRLIDEAVRCFADGVIRSARDGDAGAVFGIGFPPFRGGPFRMIATRGAADIVERMQRYNLDVAPLLREMARTGTSITEARSASRHAAP